MDACLLHSWRQVRVVQPIRSIVRWRRVTITVDGMEQNVAHGDRMPEEIFDN